MLGTSIDEKFAADSRLPSGEYTMNQASYKIETKHYFGAYMCPSCGNPAFYIVKEVKESDPIFGEYILLLDGTQPQQGQDAITCGSCGETLGGLKTEHILTIINRKATLPANAYHAMDVTNPVVHWQYD